MSKIHENDFDLDMAGIANFTFNLKDHCITDGQPWKGVETETLSGKGRIIAHAGRKSKDYVAGWFVEQLNQGSCLGCSSSSSVPRSLNFAFIGTMGFEHGGKQYTVDNVLMAQGYSTRNTWWLGGPEMSGMDTPLGGGLIAPTNKALAKVTFAAAVGYISHMNMGLVKP